MSYFLVQPGPLHDRMEAFFQRVNDGQKAFSAFVKKHGISSARGDGNGLVSVDFPTSGYDRAKWKQSRHGYEARANQKELKSEMASVKVPNSRDLTEEFAGSAWAYMHGLRVSHLGAERMKEGFILETPDKPEGSEATWWEPSPSEARRLKASEYHLMKENQP